MSIERTVYRVVGMDGLPHPVLDTLYDSVDAAILAAKQWSSSRDFSSLSSDRSLGIEVMTSNGCWRTISYS